MSNYRGGGYRDRERPGPYRDGYQDRERDRDWRGDRDRDRDTRRDPRYDDSRRRYDSHEGLERPLGDAYERNGDRRRPNRDFDRPPPRRFERDERDFNRPARYGPPAAIYDDVPRGPRAARRSTRSPSPPWGPRYDRDGRPTADYDRQAPRRRSISPSSQSSSSRRPRSPSRRLVSPAPLNREKLKSVSALKSPLESGEERMDSPMTGQTSSSNISGSSGPLTIRGSAFASGLAAPTQQQDASSKAAQSAPSHSNSHVISSNDIAQQTLPQTAPIVNSPAVPSEAASKPAPPTSRGPLSRNPSPPSPPPPAALAVPTGPRALRDGRAQPWQGPYSRGGGGFGRGRGRGAYFAGSSGMGTYAGRPSQRDYRDGPSDNNSAYRDNRRNDEEERQSGPWQNDTGPAQTNDRAGWSTDIPQKQEASTSAWGESSKSPWQADNTRSSPRDSKQGPWAASSPLPPLNDKEAAPGWGDNSPFVGTVPKEDLPGNSSPGASVWPRRDSRSNVRGPNDASRSSPGHWGDQPTPRPSDRRPFDAKDGRPALGVDQVSGGGLSNRHDPSPAKGVRPPTRYQVWQAELQATREEEEIQRKDAELLQQKPWLVHYREAGKLRKDRDIELDNTLLVYSAAARKALRDLEVLEGELTAVNLNRKLRREHLDKYKETFIGEMSGYASGDIAMI